MKQTLGQQGEDLAATYLQQQGYEILARNFRCHKGELDIICCWQGELVFVEVKTRRNLNFGYPEEAITAKKRATIRSVALTWLQQERWPYQGMRFDVISIIMSGETPGINHIKNAF